MYAYIMKKLDDIRQTLTEQAEMINEIHKAVIALHKRLVVMENLR